VTPASKKPDQKFGNTGEPPPLALAYIEC
jgi:hypothetical protein